MKTWILIITLLFTPLIAYGGSVILFAALQNADVEFPTPN